MKPISFKQARGINEMMAEVVEQINASFLEAQWLEKRVLELEKIVFELKERDKQKPKFKI